MKPHPHFRPAGQIPMKPAGQMFPQNLAQNFAQDFVQRARDNLPPIPAQDPPSDASICQVSPTFPTQLQVDQYNAANPTCSPARLFVPVVPNPPPSSSKTALWWGLGLAGLALIIAASASGSSSSSASRE